jgi:hypothetical protein
MPTTVLKIIKDGITGRINEVAKSDSSGATNINNTNDPIDDNEIRNFLLTVPLPK